MSDLSTSAIIVAAGKGSRMQSDIPKQFLLLKGQTVLFHSINKFLAAKNVSEIIVVVADEYLKSDFVQKSLPKSEKLITLVSGGKTRQESVWNGLQKVQSDNEFVLTHDGVRPLICSVQIDAAISQCQNHDGIIVAVPAVDTLKKVDGSKIIDTIDRSVIWQIQTPQIFKKEILQKAFENANQDNFLGTDESSLVERISDDVHVFQGNKTNIKITVKDDIAIATAIMDNYEN